MGHRSSLRGCFSLIVRKIIIFRNFHKNVVVWAVISPDLANFQVILLDNDIFPVIYPVFGSPASLRWLHCSVISLKLVIILRLFPGSLSSFAAIPGIQSSFRGHLSWRLPISLDFYNRFDSINFTVLLFPYSSAIILIIFPSNVPSQSLNTIPELIVLLLYCHIQCDAFSSTLVSPLPTLSSLARLQFLSLASSPLLFSFDHLDSPAILNIPQQPIAIERSSTLTKHNLKCSAHPWYAPWPYTHCPYIQASIDWNLQQVWQDCWHTPIMHN